MKLSKLFEIRKEYKYIIQITYNGDLFWDSMEPWLNENVGIREKDWEATAISTSHTNQY